MIQNYKDAYYKARDISDADTKLRYLIKTSNEITNNIISLAKDKKAPDNTYEVISKLQEINNLIGKEVAKMYKTKINSTNGDKDKLHKIHGELIKNACDNNNFLLHIKTLCMIHNKLNDRDDDGGIKKVLTNNLPTLVLFFMDWCGPCQNFLPLWDEIATELKATKKLNAIKISCQKYENKIAEAEKAGRINFIQSYPTIVLHTTDDKFIKFEGQRSKENIFNFIKNNGIKI